MDFVVGGPTCSSFISFRIEVDVDFMFALTIPEEADGNEEAEEDAEREAHFRLVDAFVALRQLDDGGV